MQYGKRENIVKGDEYGAGKCRPHKLPLHGLNIKDQIEKAVLIG